MRVKDITVPGDYEVKRWNSTYRRTIVEVAKEKTTVFERGWPREGTTWWATDSEGGKHALASVLRPWADAERDYLDARVARDRLDATIEGLTSRLSTLEPGVTVGRDFLIRSGTWTWSGLYRVVLSVDAAERLIQQGA